MANGGVEERFAGVVAALTADPRATLAPKGRGFGSGALQTGKKFFALVSSRGEYVVKLPAARVEALAAEGVGHRFDPGSGRRMREWLAVEPGWAGDWTALAREALEFVSGAG